MIIYLHGLNSSTASQKARQMLDYCAAVGVPCTAPTMPHRPAEAMRQVERLLADGGAHTVAGSSMGGYYATWLAERHPQLRAVLINPALRLADKLQSYVGQKQHNYNNGDSYLFEQAHLDEFRALQTDAISNPSRYLLLVQKGDELLDYREAVEFYQGAHSIVEEGGDHSFTGFVRHLPAIVAHAAAS